MEFSVPMALFDYVPVILYCVSAVIMQRCLYGRMTTGGFAVYCAGTMMVTAGGLFKATWKLLYALGICDFQALNHCFMPFQATGFLLAALALLAYVFSRRGKENTKLYAVPVFTSSMPFVFVMFQRDLCDQLKAELGLNVIRAVDGVVDEIEEDWDAKSRQEVDGLAIFDAEDAESGA